MPDIDIVWLGAIDCRISMGLPVNFGQGTEPEWLEAKEKFMSILGKHDKPYGGFALANPPFGSLAQVRKATERMSFCIVTGDVLHLTGMAVDLKQSREVVNGRFSGKN